MTMQDGIFASTGDLIVPAARMEDLVTTASQDELLVYDQKRHHIHHLNATAAAVWRLCDGRRTVGEIVKAASVGEDGVRLALRKLDEAHLLASPLSSTFRGATQSRRSFMKKAAIAGGAVPVIASISAPAASAQVSLSACGGGKNRPSGCSCGNGGQCSSGTCTAAKVCA